MKIKKKHRWMFNTILIHVARTWERVRLEQPHQEMPQDNIESAEDSIPSISEKIFFNDTIQGFLYASINEDDYWGNSTQEGMSDSYIEGVAEKIIKKKYLD
jgi:hypothetical protein